MPLSRAWMQACVSGWAGWFGSWPSASTCCPDVQPTPSVGVWGIVHRCRTAISPHMTCRAVGLKSNTTEREVACRDGQTCKRSVWKSLLFCHRRQFGFNLARTYVFVTFLLCVRDMTKGHHWATVQPEIVDVVSDSMNDGSRKSIGQRHMCNKV